MRRVRVRELMALLGCRNLRQLSKRLDVHYSTLSLWDRGLAFPRPKTQARIIKRLRGVVAATWLFPGNPIEGAA
jgi:hypothetical protein